MQNSRVESERRSSESLERSDEAEARVGSEDERSKENEPVESNDVQDPGTSGKKEIEKEDGVAEGTEVGQVEAEEETFDF